MELKDIEVERHLLGIYVRGPLCCDNLGYQAYVWILNHFS